MIVGKKDAHERPPSYRRVVLSRRWRRPRPDAVDLVLAAAFAGLVLIESHSRIDDGYRSGSLSWNLPILLGVVATLAWRRRAPAVALVLAYALVLVPSLFVGHTIFFFGTLLPLLILTYGAARQLSRRAALASLAGPLLTLVVVPIHEADFDTGDYLFWLTMSGIAFGLGWLMRRLDEQRAALAVTLAEQVRDQELRERALLLDERGRIARELHDVIAHGVSLMVVQAGATRLAVGVDDDEARAGALAVEAAGREALVDLRRLLGLLRPEGGEEPVAPAPGLGALDELVGRLRIAGLDVDVERHGEQYPLPAGIDLCLYRIVQESLTNVLKHAGPTRVTVRLDFDDMLRLEVVDAGPVPGHRGAEPAAGGGHGLVGMRERAKVIAGHLETGPYESGWRVRLVAPRPADPLAVSGARMRQVAG